jgi:ATP synthase assembly factor FMC1
MSTHHIQSRLRSLYRQFLRELPTRSKNTLRSPVHTRIRDNFSAGQSTAGGHERIVAQIQEGEQFVAYLKAQRMYTTLIERYNPGMGMDEAERVRLSARRVGMNLPVEHREGE